ncbi:hypothetical protein [Haloferax marinisediminis]|nr:hypothetical protein [Haloferax marinisediminis]
MDLGDLNEGREEIRRRYGETVHNDLPDADEYVRAVTAGGLVPVANVSEIHEYISRHGYRDLEAGHGPLVLGIDTNIIPWELPRILDLDHKYGTTDDAGRRPTNGYALATGVKEELDWHYKHYETNSLVEAFGPEFERLTNQPAGSNRQGFLGLYAYRALMAGRNVDRVETGTGDESIVSGYLEYQQNSRKKPLLLSNDRGFVERSVDAGLLSQHVSFTPVLPRTVSATWKEIADTLYLLSVIFGALNLPKVTLFGVWNGKSGLGWQHEKLSCQFRSPKLEPLVERQMRVLDAYDDIR